MTDHDRDAALDPAPRELLDPTLHEALDPALREALTGAFGAPELILPWIDRLLEPDELRLVAALAAGPLFLPAAAAALSRPVSPAFFDRAVRRAVINRPTPTSSPCPTSPAASRSGSSSKAGKTCRAMCAGGWPTGSSRATSTKSVPRSSACWPASSRSRARERGVSAAPRSRGARRASRARLPVAVRLPGGAGTLPQALARLPAFRERPRPGLGDLARAGRRRAARRRPPRPHAHRRGRRRRRRDPHHGGRHLQLLRRLLLSAPRRRGARRRPALAAGALRRGARPGGLRPVRTLRAPLSVRGLLSRPGRWRPRRRRASVSCGHLSARAVSGLRAVRHGLPRRGHRHGGAARRDESSGAMTQGLR